MDLAMNYEINQQQQVIIDGFLTIEAADTGVTGGIKAEIHALTPKG